MKHTPRGNLVHMLLFQSFIFKSSKYIWMKLFDVQREIWETSQHDFLHSSFCQQQCHMLVNKHVNWNDVTDLRGLFPYTTLESQWAFQSFFFSIILFPFFSLCNCLFFPSVSTTLQGKSFLLSNCAAGRK